MVVCRDALEVGRGGQGLEERAGLVKDERAEARELAGAVLVGGE
ncbi:hypothetical protein ACN28E_54965 [Archangium lansingense]